MIKTMKQSPMTFFIVFVAEFKKILTIGTLGKSVKICSKLTIKTPERPN